MWTVVLTIVVGLLVVLFLFNNKKHNYWQDKGIPVYPKCLPLVGHFFKNLNMGEYSWMFIDKHYKSMKTSKMMGMYNFFSPILIISDPEMVQNVCVKHFDHFMDRRNMDLKGSKAEVMNEILTNAAGSHWKALRSVMTPAFTSGKLKNMFYLVEEKSQLLLSHCEEKRKSDSSVNLKETFSKYTMDVIGTCAFGIETNFLGDENAEFGDAVKGMFKIDFIRILKIIVFTLSPSFSKWIGLDVSNPNQEYIVNIVKQTIEKRKNSEKRNDFVDLMLESKELGKKDEVTGKEIMTENAIIGGAILFLLAGFDTTANSLAFLALNLATHPECQDTLRKELQECISRNSNGRLTYEDVMECKYLEAAAAESLRLYPPAHAIERKCTKEYKIPGSSLVIHKDMLVAVPIYSLQRDEEYFPDPETFNPERFLPENKQSIPAGVYLPFGLGPRMCIAQRFAMMELKIAIADLILNYDLTLAKHCEELTYDKMPGIIRASNGCMEFDLKKLGPSSQMAES